MTNHDKTVHSKNIFFFKLIFFCGGHQSFLWGHWYSCFGLLVTSALGLKARVDSSLCFIALRTTIKSSESPLDTCWPLGSQHGGRAIVNPRTVQALVRLERAGSAITYHFKQVSHFHITQHQRSFPLMRHSFITVINCQTFLLLPPLFPFQLDPPSNHQNGNKQLNLVKVPQRWHRWTCIHRMTKYHS